MYLFSTAKSVLLKQQNRHYATLVQSPKQVVLLGSFCSGNTGNVISLSNRNRNKNPSSIGITRNYAAPPATLTTAIPLQFPPLKTGQNSINGGSNSSSGGGSKSQQNNSRRNIGTLQQQHHHQATRTLLEKDINMNVYNLVSRDVIDYVSLKSLLDDNPEIRRFICKIFEQSENSASHKSTSNKSNSDISLQFQHPFVQVAGNLFFQDDDFPTSLNTLGILVFLMGKLFQTTHATAAYDDDSLLSKKLMRLSRGINQSSAAFRIHRTIQETSPAPLWNKLATLAGDLLVVECIRNVASLGDNTLLLWTMDSLADFSSCEFENFQSLHSSASSNPSSSSSSLLSSSSSSRIFTPEGSLLSTGFRGVARIIYSDVRMETEMDRLGLALGSLWMDENRDDEDNLLIMKESLDILSRFPDSEITHFFKDFVYYWLHRK